MKAISIKQPWAEFIARGIKTIELRSWKTNYRGDLLIVASLRPDDFVRKINSKQSDRGIFCEFIDKQYSEFNDYFQFGKALAIVTLTSIDKMKIEHESRAQSDFNPDLFSWHLSNVRRIDPFNVKGKLSIYEVDYTV